APMEVHGASPSAKSARTSNADEPDLRQFAKQMLSRPAAGTPVPAEDELLPATGQAGVQASAESQALAAPTAARQTVAPPVVAPDPNESLPLGRHAAGQPTGSSGDASSHGLGWGATQTLIALAVVVGLILLGRQ